MQTPLLILIKNMVCHRCILVVEDILKKNKIDYRQVAFGEVQLNKALTGTQRLQLIEDLSTVGFELIDDRNSEVIEKIKQLVILKARNKVNEQERVLKLSTYLSNHLHHEYTYLSSLFSSIEGRTIENYFIEQRIENAKELLVYGQMTLSQIAMELEYSSTAHLSSQFKKVTGLTPSHFKEIGIARRKSLDDV